MPDVFISCSETDIQIAAGLKNRLAGNGLSAFLYSVSLVPGKPWSNEIRAQLNQSNVVIVLASRAGLTSDFVKQEVGGAIFQGKRVVPIVWDMAPEELPGFLKEYHALDLRGNDLATIASKVDQFVDGLVKDKQKQLVALAVMLAFITILALAPKS